MPHSEWYSLYGIWYCLFDEAFETPNASILLAWVKVAEITFWRAFTWYHERTYAYTSPHLQNSNLYFVLNKKILLKKSSFQISFFKLILKRFWVFDLVQSSKKILEFSSKPTKYWCTHPKLILRSYGNTMRSLKD